MEKKLPKGWVLCQLQDIGKAVTGNTPSRKNSDFFGGNIPWIKPGDLKDKFITEHEESLTESGANVARVLPPYSVMISCIGNLGKIGIIDKEATTNQQINSVVFNQKIVKPYYGFYYALTLKKWLIENSSATTVSIINKGRFEKAPIPLPPLAEQNRMVEKLDALFGHLEQVKTKLDKVPTLLKNFRQAVLNQAVTGKLTESNSVKNLGDFNINIQTGPFGSALHKHEYIENGIPVINPSHIFDGIIVPNNQVTISDTKYEKLKRWKLEEGDVIVGRRGEMGRAAVYLDNDELMICGTGSLILKKSSEINSLFLMFHLRSPFVVDFLERNSVGSTMVNLNQKIIKSIPFPDISIEEQIKRIEKIESLFAKADKIEQRYHSLKAKTDTLPQAILAKAFKGELVEQLPTDGDARELLAEILKVNAELGKAGRVKRRKVRNRKSD